MKILNPPLAAYKYGFFTKKNNNKQNGYTLLEVIIAFALLALATTLLLGTLTGGVKQITNSEKITLATLHTQSLLNELGTETPLTIGVYSGVFEPQQFPWKITITPYQASANYLANNEFNDSQLLQIEIQVNTADSNPQTLLHWKTLRWVTIAASSNAVGGN